MTLATPIRLRSPKNTRPICRIIPTSVTGFSAILRKRIKLKLHANRTATTNSAGKMIAADPAVSAIPTTMNFARKDNASARTSPAILFVVRQGKFVDPMGIAARPKAVSNWENPAEPGTMVVGSRLIVAPVQKRILAPKVHAVCRVTRVAPWMKSAAVEAAAVAGAESSARQKRPTPAGITSALKCVFRPDVSSRKRLFRHSYMAEKMQCPIGLNPETLFFI